MSLNTIKATEVIKFLAENHITIKNIHVVQGAYAEPWNTILARLRDMRLHWDGIDDLVTCKYCKAHIRAKRVYTFFDVLPILPAPHHPKTCRCSWRITWL